MDEDIETKKLFTYAFSGQRGWYNKRGGGGLHSLHHLYFLFQGDFDAKARGELLQLPVFDSFFPLLRFGIQLPTGYAVTDDLAIMSPSFADGLKQRLPCVISGEGYQLVNPRQIQDDCTLPHRMILGCQECIDEPENPELHCRIKKWHLELKEQRVPPEVTEELNGWKNLDHQIGEHTFVRPSYAHDRFPFASKLLDITDISFNHVKTNIEMRKDAALARSQRRNFEKKVCSTCLVQRQCPSTRPKWCDGAYDKTEEEYYDHILDVSAVPFTNAQLSYLLSNSGRLENRFNKKEAYLSFRYRDGLQFMLGYVRTGDEVPLTYKQAVKVIQQYGHENLMKHRMTKKMKAMLIAMSSLTSSPTRKSRWHSTSYPVRFLQFEYGAYYQYFFWRRGGIASWHFRADNLLDIYRAHERLPFVSKTNSPLSLRRTNGRYDGVRLY